MSDPTPNAVPAAIPLAAIVIGVLLALAGLLRPGFFWNSGRIQSGRGAIGDTGMSLAFVVLGVVLGAIGARILTRK
jgi:predicted permease